MKTSGDISKNPRAMAKLLKEARRVRQVLSANTDHMAQIEGLFEEKDFRLKVLRSELEEMCKDLFDRVDQPIKMALDAAAMTMVSSVKKIFLCNPILLKFALQHIHLLDLTNNSKPVLTIPSCFCFSKQTQNL